MYLGKVIGRVVATVKDSALEAKTLLQFDKAGRSFCELREKAELNRGQQRAGGEKPHTQLQDRGRVQKG